MQWRSARRWYVPWPFTGARMRSGAWCVGACFCAPLGGQGDGPAVVNGDPAGACGAWQLLVWQAGTRRGAGVIARERLAVWRRKGTNGIGNETAGVVRYFSKGLLWCGQPVNYPLARLSVPCSESQIAAWERAIAAVEIVMVKDTAWTDRRPALAVTAVLILTLTPSD